MWKEFEGYLVNTILLLWLKRKNDSGNSSSDKAADFALNNTTSIGNAIPVILGRGMIKNPLVSFYGDADSSPYTEEYGMHTRITWKDMIPTLILGILAAVLAPDEVVVAVDAPVIGGEGGTAKGPSSGKTINAGVKRAAILNIVVSVLLWLMTSLFANHGGRTTIQKGFKYYLGWQNIICWTGNNFGIKRIWMNVYDSNLESSTEQGIWGSDSIAWKNSNKKGIVAHIDKPDMFGGPDEQGGFVGDIRLYFGTKEQGRDSWMVNQMTISSGIPQELKGLTPVYPMFFTCVIPKAYIGKQSTIPEMWFEVVNYPSNLKEQYPYNIQVMYNERISELLVDSLPYFNSQPPIVITAIGSKVEEFTTSISKYKEVSSKSSELLQSYNKAKEINILYPTAETEKAVQQAEKVYKIAQASTDQAFNDIKNRYIELNNIWPKSEQDEFEARTKDLANLLNSGAWHLGRLGDDINPAEAIYEMLTNNLWGCNYDVLKIDIDSLLKMGATLEEEGFGISCNFSKVSKVSQYIEKILTTINGTCYDDPMTGKLTFKLIRGDYDINSLVQFDTSNVSSLEFSRLDWSETTSAIVATFTDASNKYDQSTMTVQDVANVFITHNYNEGQADGEYLTTPDNVRRFAQTQLLSSGYPLAAVNIKTNRIAHNLTIGSPIVIHWDPYGIKSQVMRITDIDYATLVSGEISITAVEDVFSFDKVEYGDIVAPGWKDPVTSPVSVSVQKFIEMPYEITRSLNTYINAYSAKTVSTNVYQNVWRFK